MICYFCIVTNSKMAKDKSKKIISTNQGDSSKKNSNKKIVDTGVASSKKKVVVKSKPNVGNFETNRSSRTNVATQELLFNRNNYLFIAAAFGIIMLGMLLMMGGDMPDSNTWDESIIYSTRRTLLAPIVILVGLVVGVYSIFRD